MLTALVKVIVPLDSASVAVVSCPPTLALPPVMLKRPGPVTLLAADRLWVPSR